jgi:hypothetical protein
VLAVSALRRGRADIRRVEIVSDTLTHTGTLCNGMKLKETWTRTK